MDTKSTSDRIAEAIDVLAARWSASPYRYDRDDAAAMAERHLERHKTYGTLDARLAVILDGAAACHNCGVAVSDVPGDRPDRCNRCQVLGSDFY